MGGNYTRRGIELVGTGTVGNLSIPSLQGKRKGEHIMCPPYIIYYNVYVNFDNLS